MKRYINDILTKILTLTLLLILGASEMWGQETQNYSGTYFIKSVNNNNNTAGDYYICPTKNWYLYKAPDKYEDDTDGDDDNEKPFLTTYQCINNANYVESKAVWTIVKHSTKVNCYYIIQSRTGRYMVSNGTIGSSAYRMRVHLESVADATALSALGDLALFEITPHDDHIDIVPHSSAGRVSDTYKYLVVNFKNFNELIGSAGKTGGPSGTYGDNTAGIIGLYDTENNHKWSLQEALPVTSAPNITNNYDGTITMTAASGTIYYTTDGTDPTTSSSTYSDAITLTDEITVIKAMAKDGNSYESMVVTYVLPKCDKPVITVSNGTVTITNTTEGASICYTTDDTPPTSSSTPYGSSFFLGDISVIRAIAVMPGWAKSDEAYYMDFKTVSSSTEMTNPHGLYRLASGFTSTASIGTASEPFCGVIDGQMNTISGLGHALVGYADGAIIKNVILDNVDISSGITVDDKESVGAICNYATGDTRIYNCGVLATTSTVKTDDDGYTVITDCTSEVSGDDYVGGIVGFLDGSSRVINCYSYANITGGDYVGGVVGWNNVATNANSEDAEHYLKTMVMNCIFYGDIDYTATTSNAPVYNGEIITNRSDGNGVSNFNYFWAGASYVQEQKIDNDRYNCALSAETRFLQRFEFFRHLLNSNREFAAWWATGSRDNKDEMMKWVMVPSLIRTSTPYPILKAPKDEADKVIKYPSVVNIDVNHSATESAIVGPKVGKTLSVTINSGSNAPTGASITTSSLSLEIQGKDPSHFNFNYYKVQLPYYNDVGTGNYTGKKVVTGWEVTVSGGNHDFTTSSEDASLKSISDDGDIELNTPYNYADRKSTQKDNYSTNGNRIFNQGAYFDVPEGVTSISIKPHWAKCEFVADEYMDVVYNKDMDTPANVTSVGGGKRYESGTINIGGTDYAVNTTMSDAVTALNPSGTVYDNAIVLVGNVHNIGITSDKTGKPFTIMSIDLDKDNEPDYSYILRFNGRNAVHPVRIDFLNVIGLGMAQKSTGGTGTYNFGIMNPLDWFEVTNTGLFRVTQFEYEHKNRNAKPIIIHGGVIEQWVSAQSNGNGNKTNYIHVGGNVWFKEFHIGWHQDNPQSTKHPPVSVTGGDFDNFYLTGFYATTAANYNDNAECYINGGRFGKMAGTGMEGIGGFTMEGKVKISYTNGDIIWQIDNADIDEFYAGGINAAHIAEGNIYTVISNSRVDQFCGGPKFGDMNPDKVVVTNAENCTFRIFFGAGYGGNSYNRYYPRNKISIINMTNPTWNGWLQNGNTDAPSFAGYKNAYIEARKGVEARIDYQFIPMSDNQTNVARLFVDYVSFSLATTCDVTSKLKGCTIKKGKLGRLDIKDDDQRLGNYYGGGSLGKVEGPVKSTLTNCTVEGNVFGAGYSATLPTVNVMKNSFKKEPKYDPNLGAYLEAELPETDAVYKWSYKETVNSTETAIETIGSEHFLYTSEDIRSESHKLGSVSGAVTLTITTSGNGKTSTIGTSGDTTSGNVYGGGDESYVSNADTPSNAYTVVNIAGNTEVFGNVFGGGNNGEVSGSATVNIVQTLPTTTNNNGN